jgi:Fe-S-cluster-containing dehydrogenase component
MKNYVILVDISKCTQCYNCVLACKDEHFGSDFSPISIGPQELNQDWLGLKVEERGKGDKIRVECRPEGCRHCAEPECVKASDAVYQREDHIVIIDPVKAAGQKELLSACPYHAISWNAERGLPQKCTLCAHLLDAGEKEPRCVEACPTTALTFGDANDPNSEVSKLLSAHPEAAAQTGIVRYINELKPFAAGSVYKTGGKEVAADVRVTLSAGGAVVAETVTNFFGDYLFSDLEKGTYTLAVSAPGYLPQTATVHTEDADAIVGDITLFSQF